MAKAKKSNIEDIKMEHIVNKSLPPGDLIDLKSMANVSEMTIIEIMHQKNISREDAISFIKNNERK